MSRQFDLIGAAAPVMQKLASETGQTAQLGILQDFGVMYIEQKLPARPVNIIAALRTVIPVYVSASGKVLVANLPAAEQSDFLAQTKLVAQTENSVVDVTQFRAALQTVRANGYALDIEEYARGIGCVAATIHDYRGVVIVAIGVTGAIVDYLVDEAARERLIALTRTAAAEASRTMGAPRREKE